MAPAAGSGAAVLVGAAVVDSEGMAVAVGEVMVEITGTAEGAAVAVVTLASSVDVEWSDKRRSLEDVGGEMVVLAAATHSVSLSIPTTEYLQ